MWNYIIPSIFKHSTSSQFFFVFTKKAIFSWTFSYIYLLKNKILKLLLKLESKSLTEIFSEGLMVLFIRFFFCSITSLFVCITFVKFYAIQKFFLYHLYHQKYTHSHIHTHAHTKLFRYDYFVFMYMRHFCASLDNLYADLSISDKLLKGKFFYIYLLMYVLWVFDVLNLI